MNKNSRLIINYKSVVLLLIILSPLLYYFIVINHSIISLIQILIILVILPIFFINDLMALLTLVAVRPAIDILGDSLIELGQISINLSSAISLLTIIWCLIILFKYTKVKIWKKPLFYPILFFIIVCLLSLFYSVYPEITFRELTRLISIFLLYFSALILITSKTDLFKLGKALLFSLILPVIFCLIQIFTRSGLSFGEIENRIYGTFGHPNVLAFYLVLSIGLLLSYWLNQKKTSRQKIILYAIIVLLLLLALTLTRGAWLGIAAFFLVLGVLKYRKALLIIIGICLFFMIIAPTVNNLTFKYFGYDFRTIPIINRLTNWQSEDSSIDWRIKLWNDMRQKFDQKPLLGYGLGTFSKIREQQIKDFFQGTEAHNDYLRLAIETGLVGLIIYFILLIAILKNSIRNYLKSSPTNKIIHLGFLGLVIAFMVMSFFDNILQATSVMWLFWISMAGFYNFSVNKLNIY